jgi:hypothetical protein
VMWFLTHQNIEHSGGGVWGCRASRRELIIVNQREITC